MDRPADRKSGGFAVRPVQLEQEDDGYTMRPVQLGVEPEEDYGEEDPVEDPDINHKASTSAWSKQLTQPTRDLDIASTA